MALRSKKDVLSSIREVTKTVDGKTYTQYEIYFGTDHATGAKLRKTKARLSEAKACVDEFFAQVKEHGEFPMGVITIRELYDAREALDTIAEARLTVSLYEVVRRFVEGSARTMVKSMALGAAYDEYFAGIADIQKLHRRAVNSRVRRWVTAFGAARLCTEVNSPAVAEYLAPIKKASVKSFNNALGYIKTFMTWCAASERRYVSVNPLADMGLAKLAYKEPSFMRADDVEKMMLALERHRDAPRLVSYAVLSFFCGVRQEEIKRLSQTPSDIMLDEEIIRISMPKGWTQGIIPRVVQIPPNALAWLRAYDTPRCLRSNTERTVKTIQAAAGRAGVDFPKNSGRHTFITMHVAAFADSANTEAMCGTSARMRTSHYQGLTSKKEGERYFAICPSPPPH